MFDKDIPIPQIVEKYHLGMMEIGDSFLVAGNNTKSVRVSAANYKKRHPGWNYTCKKTPDGLRLWRIS